MGPHARVLRGAPSLTRYRGASTVIENASHGPHLCTFVMTSRPPQGSGVPLVGWSWSDVPWHESAGGTTWADVTVTGELVDGSLVVDGVRPFRRRELDPPPGPLCDAPDGDPSLGQRDTDLDLEDDADVLAIWVSHDPYVVNVVAAPGTADRVRAAVGRTWSGLLCIAERTQPTRARLLAIVDEAMRTARTGTPLGPLSGGGPRPELGVVDLHVTAVTPEAEAYARERWGDAVRLVGFLEPIAQPSRVGC